MYHSSQKKSLKCQECGLFSKEVSKSYFDENNYCINCLIEAIKKVIIEQDSAFKKPDIS